jgi:sulfite exporter TauE/SafE
VAGVLANLTGALLVTTLGTSTTALMLKSGTLRDWLYSGQHLSPLALYHQEIYDSTGTEMYVAMCVAFPVIGLIMGAIGVAGMRPREAFSDDGAIRPCTG